MMHIRGHRSDFDAWAYQGCPGWGYDDVLPYFQKLGDQEDDTSAVAGHGGPLRVQAARLHEPSPASQAFLDACQELGFPRTDDFNGPQMLGAGWHHLNIKNGLRHDMATAYLYPALESRRNLSLIDGAQVARLIFAGHRCMGVEIRQGSESRRIAARAEVVVCCGASRDWAIVWLNSASRSWRTCQPSARNLAVYSRP